MSEQTLDKLRKMRLPAFAEEYQKQKGNAFYHDMTFDDRLTLMVDREFDTRSNNTVTSNIRKAGFYDSNACLENINFKPERKIDKNLINELHTNEYIKSGLNIILIGAAGSGKTWISCAFGVNACRHKLKVQYIRCPELMNDFEVARIQGTYRRFLKQLNKIDLLILDEFLLTGVSDEERNDLLELIESRCNRKSTIFCSQWSPQGWYQRLGEGPVADAILDRILNSSYTITLNGSSMREDYSRIR